MPKSGKEHVTCPTQGPWGRGRENAKVNSVIDVAELTGCLKAYLYHKTGHCLKGCCLLVFFVDFVFCFFFFLSVGEMEDRGGITVANGSGRGTRKLKAMRIRAGRLKKVTQVL